MCVHNAGRSQMAAALLDHLAGGRVTVRSAGSEPADRINPRVVAAMEEIGLDVSREFPKPLTGDAVQAADVVITMGCGDACPIYPGKRYEDWELDDPAAGRPRRRPPHPRRDRRARRGASSASSPRVTRERAAGAAGCSPSSSAPRSSRPSSSAPASPRSGCLPTTPGSRCSRTPPPPPRACSRSSSCSAPVSGGHFNPVVSLVDAAFGGLTRRDALAYIPAQIAGCITGAIVANAMFALTAISISTAPPRQPRAPVRRGHRDARPAARDLLARPHRPRGDRAGRGRRLHRRRVLVHELDELRQPRDHRRPRCSRHVRRHRARLGPGFVVASWSAVWSRSL